MLARRNVLQSGLSLGALTRRTGCDLSDHDNVQRLLARFSEWNDMVRAFLLGGQRLAPTFPEAMAVKDYALPQVRQVTRHVCVEGWSMIGKRSGTPLRTFLERIGADSTARYVGFECADGYYEGIDMPTALHPQTLMAFRLSDEILPAKCGYPFKLRIPTKLGFKNPKFVIAIYITNHQPRGYWTDRGYNWFSGI
jgi:hypothetical protein